MTAKRFEIECISFDKNDIFEDMVKQLQSKEVFLVSLHERFENEVINENTPPLLVMPCPNQNVLDNVCELLNVLHEENRELKTKISFIIDNRIQVYQKHIKKCESMLKLNDNAKQYSDLFNAKVEELEQLKKELLRELE